MLDRRLKPMHNYYNYNNYNYYCSNNYKYNNYYNYLVTTLASAGDALFPA